MRHGRGDGVPTLSLRRTFFSFHAASSNWQTGHDRSYARSFSHCQQDDGEKALCRAVKEASTQEEPPEVPAKWIVREQSLNQPYETSMNEDRAFANPRDEVDNLLIMGDCAVRHKLPHSHSFHGMAALRNRWCCREQGRLEA